MTDMDATLRRAREIADDVFFAAAARTDETNEVPVSHLDLLASEGFYAIAGPEDLGGVGQRSPMEIIETFASGCLSTALVWAQHHGSVRMLSFTQNQELRDEYLEPLCRGEVRSGVVFAGAVPGPIQLRATPVPDGYVFDGVAPWMTGWSYDQVMAVAARTDDDTVVWALLDVRATNQLSMQPLRMVALTSSDTVSLTFTDYFVPKSRVIAAVPLAAQQMQDSLAVRLNGNFSIGLISRAARLLGPSPLDDEIPLHRKALVTVSDADLPAARAAMAELAVRTTAALVTATGSKALIAGHAQRLAREALFLLVFASRPALKSATLDRLTTSHAQR